MSGPDDDFQRGQIPTTENLLLHRASGSRRGWGMLGRLRLHDDETFYVEYKGG